MSTTSWFEVDRAGLARLREATPKSALVFELVQNAWDTDATECRVSLKPIAGTRSYELIVEDDDPTGFADLSHAYTLFADSAKKNHADKRGRFNFGEKLVLAMCKDAEISSTQGTVAFDESGRTVKRRKLDKGSIFRGTIPMTKAEYDEVSSSMNSLLPPPSCATFYNDEKIEARAPIAEACGILPTVIADHEGSLRPSRRKAPVQIVKVRPGEKAMVYELGIPVVESGDTYHYNVMQKVPLTLDRANVTPAFLREVRTVAAEAMREQITSEDANMEWVRTAAGNPEASPELVRKAFAARFGEKAAIFDPSDREANLKAVLNGYTLVTGSQLSRDEWANVRSNDIATAAGRIFPSVPAREQLNDEGVANCPMCGGKGRI